MEMKRRKNACTNSLTASLSLYPSLSLGDNMAHLSGAISGFQVIDCHSCPVLGLVKANLGLSVVSSFGTQIKK